MDGSGLKEALGKIYVTNSVDRNIRGHTLLQLTLSMIIFEDIEIEDGMLDKLVEQITC